MPLLKILGALLGRDPKPHNADQHPKDVKRQPESPKPPEKSPRRAEKTRVRSFGSLGGQHAGLCKLIRKTFGRGDEPIRVLELGIGDGKRSEAVLSTLLTTRAGHDLQYFAVDLFEMGEGEVTLKDFNRTLRNLNVKPQLFPMPVDVALNRIANTFGQVDLVIDGQGFHKSESAAKLISRVAGVRTVLVAATDGVWRHVEIDGRVGDRKRAA